MFFLEVASVTLPSAHKKNKRVKTKHSFAHPRPTLSFLKLLLGFGL